MQPEIKVLAVRAAGPNDCNMIAHVDLDLAGVARIEGALLVDTGDGPRFAQPRIGRSGRVTIRRAAAREAVKVALAMLKQEDQANTRG